MLRHGGVGEDAVRAVLSEHGIELDDLGSRS
jgi:hypothetical protein